MERRGRTTSGFAGAAEVVDEKARLEEALSEAEARVACMDPSPVEGRLRQTLAAFRRLIATWSLRPPSDEEICFLRDRLAEVLHEAKHESPTLRLRRPA